jgi:sorbitol/mannitol transport system permease protein
MAKLKERAQREEDDTAKKAAPSGESGIGGMRMTPWRRRAPLMPALIWVIIFTQIPMAMTLFYSTQRWNMMRPDQRGFAGFDNYAFILQDPQFRNALLNTVVLTVAAVVFSLLIGLGFALLLNRQFPGRGFARTLFITPFLVMPVAAALLWKYIMFDPVYGLLNVVLDPIFGQINWATSLPMTSIVIVVVWQWTPFFMLIQLAGLQSQDVEQHEAMQTDGAGKLAIFRFLTLPALRPYMELSVLLGTVFIVQTFDAIFMITQGGPGQSTTNVPFFVYLQAFRALDVGQAAAAAVIVVIATIIIAMIALRSMSQIFQVGEQR